MPQSIPLIIAATSVASVGLTAVGTIQQSRAASAQAASSAEIASNQRRIEAERRKAAELEARRKQLEIIRQQSRARALALSNATGQGAQYSSGLQGGYAQIAGETNNSLLNLNQNLEIGRNIFGFNENISNQRDIQAQASAQAAQGQGLSSLGGALMASLGPISRLSGGFGGSVGSTSYSTSGGYGVTGSNNSYAYIG